MRRSLALLSTLALTAVGSMAAGGTVAGAQAPAAPTGSPLQLWAPSSTVAYSYEGQVYSDLGLRLVAPDAPFELWSTRASYDDPIVTEWRTPAGDQTLPAGTMPDFTGLPDFLTLKVRRAADAGFVFKRSFATCIGGGNAVRIRPDAPARSAYPQGCPANPYTLGSVMGIQQGWASGVFSEWGAPFSLKPGSYTVTAFISKDYRSTFGIAREDARRTYALEVRTEGQRTTRPTGHPSPAAVEPTASAGGTVAGPVPDLRSLPAFSVMLNRKGTALRFAANVWNAGDSPLVVDGFRRADEDVMDAYQYFFDTDGNQTGYQQVGEMHFHEGNHHHWHLEDFAEYTLLDEDLALAVKSTKQSFCLANTDAVDYTVPGADWRPQNTDLSTACGGQEALSIREVLSSGSGDTYFQYRTGQAFRLGDLPNGTYYIAVTANPLGNLVESDTTNNQSLRRIQLGGRPGQRWVEAAPVGIVEETWPGMFRPALR